MNNMSRGFLPGAIALLAVMVSACSMPSYVTSLNEVIEQELGRNGNPVYRYRCTAGAHRGASVEFRENTLEALQAAEMESKYAFIEFDVQYSKDKRIVVFHDNRLLRLFGSLRAVGGTTFAELAELTGGEIAAYDDAMDMLTKKINIEIKSQGDAEEDRRLADEIIADLKRRGRDKDVLISSISADVIRYIKEKYPAMPTGQVYWLTSSTYFHLDSLTEGLYQEFNTSRADYLMMHVANLHNIEDLLKLKPVGKTIVFWDFADGMYLVHKDLDDRIWGESAIVTLYWFAKYWLFSAFRPPEPGVESLP